MHDSFASPLRNLTVGFVEPVQISLDVSTALSALFGYGQNDPDKGEWQSFSEANQDQASFAFAAGWPSAGE